MKNVTNKRTFSLLKLIKSYLRLTMKQSRLNHFMILSNYKNQLDQLDLTKISSDCINKSDTRKNVFGSKFNYWVTSMHSALFRFSLVSYLWCKKNSKWDFIFMDFYMRYHFKVLRLCTQLCFRLYFKYSLVSWKRKDCCRINTWDMDPCFVTSNNFSRIILLLNVFALGL